MRATLRNLPLRDDLEIVVWSGGIPSAGSIDRTQKVALVDFEIRECANLWIEIRRGTDYASGRLDPSLAPVLGAFVVPYMLLSIIYEPPGKDSQAIGSIATETGTTIGFTFSRTTGQWSTVDYEAESRMVSQLYGEAVSGISGSPIPKAIMDATTLLSESPDIHFINTVTSGVSNATGWYVRLERFWDTGVNDGHDYPGQGERFVILRDVLFVYAPSTCRVLLAPVAYAGVHAPISSRLGDYVPEAVADGFRALDPLIANPSIGPYSRRSGWERAQLGARFVKLPDHLECVDYGGEGIVLDEARQTALGTFRITSQIEVQEAAGLSALLGEGTNKIVGFEHESRRTDIEEDSHESLVRVKCETGDQFEVEVWFDRIFRTFVCLRGPAIAADAVIQGEVASTRGEAVVGRHVMLRIGGQRYHTHVDHEGRFRFRFKGIPRGLGMLSMGGSRLPVRYVGVPLRHLKIMGSESEANHKIPERSVREP